MTVVYTCDVCGATVDKESFAGNRYIRLYPDSDRVDLPDACRECCNVQADAFETAIGKLVGTMRFHDSREYAFRDWEEVQLAGPMTGVDGWNRAAFAEVRGELARVYGRSLCTFVFDPAEGASQGDDDHAHAHWMLRTLSKLARYDQYVNEKDFKPRVRALVLLPGWEKSEGAVAEAIVAHECGIDLVLWRGLGDGE